MCSLPNLLRPAILPGLFLSLWLLLSPVRAYADAPVTRGPETPATGATDAGARWHDVRPLPPLGTVSSTMRGPSLAADDSSTGLIPGPSLVRQAGSGGGITGWIDRNLNPGNWLMDAVLGGNTGMLLTAVELAGLVVAPLADPRSRCLGVVFCTPTEILFGQAGSMSIGLYAVWGRLEAVAVALATIFFILRIGQLVTEGPQSLRTDGPGVVLALVGAVIFIFGSGSILRWIVDLFNAINDTILGGEDFKILDVFQPGAFNFGLVLIQFGAAIMVLIFVIMGYVRLLKLFILMCFAPLMGALLLLGATAATFWQWLKAIISLLLQQTAWSLAFLVGITLATPSGSMPHPSQNVGSVNEIAGLLIALVLTMLSRKALDQVVQLVPVRAQGRSLGRQLLGYAMVGANIGRRGGSASVAAVRGAVIGGAPGAVAAGAGAVLGRTLGRRRSGGATQQRDGGTAGSPSTSAQLAAHGPTRGALRAIAPPVLGRGDLIRQRHGRPPLGRARSGARTMARQRSGAVAVSAHQQQEAQAYHGYPRNYRRLRTEQRRAHQRGLGRAVMARRAAQTTAAPPAQSASASGASARQPVLLRRVPPASQGRLQRRHTHAALGIRRAEQFHQRARRPQQPASAGGGTAAYPTGTATRIDPALHPLRTDALLQAAGQPRPAPHRRRVAMLRRAAEQMPPGRVRPASAAGVAPAASRSPIHPRARRSGYRPPTDRDQAFLQALDRVPPGSHPPAGSQESWRPAPHHRDVEER